MNDTAKMLRVNHLSKGFGRAKQSRVSALDNISFDVHQAEFFTLLGPSGCGKSTLLRCIAGIETPDNGEIYIADNHVFSSTENKDVAVNRRRLGMVFQSFAIWPHMSVFENVAFGLRAVRKANGWTIIELQDRAMAALALVALDQLSARRGADLSGGQKQRLALARAIAAESKLILLDEPLSNLDATLRERLGQELKDLQLKLGLTFLYVTHDQNEALSLSDRIAVVNGGQIQQIGSPEDIYRKPCNRFVAEFVGKSNSVAPQENHIIRPEDIQLSTERRSDGGWQECRFIARQYFGDHAQICVSFQGVLVNIKVAADFNSPKNGLLYLKFDDKKLVKF